MERVATKWALIIIATHLAGCGASVLKPDNYSDNPRPLLSAIERRAEAIKSLSGQLEVEIWRSGKRVRMKQLVAADGRGRLRLEVLSPFGQPLTSLVSDGSRLMIYLADQKRFLLGAATPENLARLLPIPMSPDELAALLRGSIPTITYHTARVVWLAESGRYQLELVGDQRRQKIEFEPQYLRVTALETLGKGTVLYRAKFGDYVGAGDTAIPRRMRFEVPADDLRIDLKVADYSLNPELPEAAFVLEPPRGIQIEAM